MMNNKRIHDRQETNKNLKFIMLSLILIIMMYIFREKIYNVDTIFCFIIINLLNKK
jgi:hypothetical protein